MKLRPTPALVVAVLALVVSLAGTSYAAVKITSAQIKNGTVKSADLKNDGVKSKDVKDGSLTAADLAPRSCAASDVAVLGSCVDRAASGPTSFVAALADCDSKGGRLMTWTEYRVLRDKSGITWANGDANQYEFLDLQEVNGGTVTPSAIDLGGNGFPDASAQNFWHRCVTPL